MYTNGVEGADANEGKPLVLNLSGHTFKTSELTWSNTSMNTYYGKLTVDEQCHNDRYSSKSTGDPSPPAGLAYV